MIKFFTVAAAACLLAATPALAERTKTTHTTTVHTSTGGGGTTTRSMHTSHVTVIHGTGGAMTGGTHTRSLTRTTTGGTRSHTFTTHRSVAVLRSFHRNFTATHRYHFGAVYSRPHGWYSHRWVYGESLPGGWYGQDYWIPNYAMFGLIDPPDEGYQWVRVGDDALLVDTDSGEVLQVEYGVFY
jgi:Ni/Co efflux regulator RcnB